MYLLIIFLPFLGSFLSGLFGRYLGSQGCSKATIYCLFFSLVFSLAAFYESAIGNCPVYICVACWVSSQTLNADWGYMFDSLTLTMCIVVTFISLVVHIYSIEYMHGDPHQSRFMSYLSLFTFFMLLLVTADNFLQMFMGWEGVGLCSYLLINFWFTRIQANKAAVKALLVNRVGDFSIVIAILLIAIYYKSIDYATVAALTPFLADINIMFLNINFSLVNIVCFCLFVGAVGKSAQLGLHTWLPDAMEGPTPVSALIHAATMVTAGIFLIARTSFLFEYASPYINDIFAIVGALTAFFASTTGLLQNDLKKVIAYSTCSQLGYMMFACGMSGYNASVFHLANHAFFKALLFLGAGSVIHSINDEQDIRKMGGLQLLLPATYSMMLVGSMALSGFPFLSGFYSKDSILEIAVAKFSTIGYFCYGLGVVGAFFTAFYSLRLLYLIFLTLPNGHRRILCYTSEPGIYIIVALAVLIFPSILIGYFTKDMSIGLGSSFFNSSIYVKSYNVVLPNVEFGLDCLIKILPLYLSINGIVIAFLLYTFESEILYKLKVSEKGKIVYNFLNRKWFFDKLYNEILIQSLFKFGYSISYKFIDRGVFEIIGPTGLSLTLSKISYFIKKATSGQMYHYNLIAIASLTYILGFKIIESCAFNITTISTPSLIEVCDVYNAIASKKTESVDSILFVIVFFNVAMLFEHGKSYNFY